MRYNQIKIAKMKFLLFLIGTLSSLLIVGQQGTLTLHGKVENESQTLSYVDFEVYKDNEVFYKGQTMRNGSFKIDLDLGHVYNVAFSKDGYVEKSVAVISASDSTITGRYFFQMDLELFRVEQDAIDETMLPPVAKLYIIDENEGFRYDKKYVKWISNKYDDL
tara:strand:- start:1079 stop:1567 length:489 start_codon:yes stop_codon:yes gene_type:complete